MRLLHLIVIFVSLADRVIQCYGKDIDNIKIHMPLVETQRVSDLNLNFNAIHFHISFKIYDFFPGL